MWSRSGLWRINARRFLRRAGPLLGLQKTDAVLDIGCGPGDLARALAPMVEVVYAVDTSPRMVARCRARCRDVPNVVVKQLGSEYTDLTRCGRRFSVFLCVGVVQYYDRINQVEALIRSAQRLALPGARMLIADWPRRRTPWGRLWDLGGSLALSVRERDVAPLLAAAATHWRSAAEYWRVSRRTGILKVSPDELRALARRLPWDAAVITAPLSLCAHRPSLLIRW